MENSLRSRKKLVVSRDVTLATVIVPVKAIVAVVLCKTHTFAFFHCANTPLEPPTRRITVVAPGPLTIYIHDDKDGIGRVLIIVEVFQWEFFYLFFDFLQKIIKI